MQPIFIDVREPSEYALDHVEGALNLPPAEIMAGATAISHLAKDTPLVVYCVSGSRSNVAINILDSLGYTNLTNGINQRQVEARYS